MKKILTTIAAAVIATTAAAQSTYDRDNNMVASRSQETDEIAMLVSVWPQNGCKPQFILAGTGNVEYEYVNYKLRIDRKSAWTMSGEIGNSEDYAYAFTNAPQRLINELRRGNIARVQMPMKDGSHSYYSFSLAGFSRAYGKAKAACIPPSQYFEQTAPRANSNAEYFL